MSGTNANRQMTKFHKKLCYICKLLLQHLSTTAIIHKMYKLHAFENFSTLYYHIHIFELTFSHLWSLMFSKT